MNWIKRLFGQKQISTSDIEFNEIEDWLDERSGSISEKVGIEARALYPDIEHALKKLKKNTEVLRQATPEGRFHLKMVKVASSNRDNMVRQVTMLIENITIPGSADVRTVQDFHDSAMQTLGVCLENMLKSYQYAKLVFAEESKLVIADVNAVGRLLNELIAPVSENKRTLDALDNAGNGVKTIKKLYSDIEKDTKTLIEKEDTIDSFQKQITGIKEQLEKLKKSQDWTLYQDKNNELSRLEEKLKGYENDIYVLFLPLNKALTRLRQLSDSERLTLPPGIKECLGLCFTDPKCIDSGFFEELRKIIESDALSLPQDKKDKVLGQINIARSTFETQKERYQTVLEDIARKKSEISGMNIASEEKAMNDRYGSLISKLDIVEKEHELLKKRLATFELELDSKKHEFQQMISLLDPKLTVRFNP